MCTYDLFSTFSNDVYDTMLVSEWTQIKRGDVCSEHGLFKKKEAMLLVSHTHRYSVLNQPIPLFYSLPHGPLVPVTDDSMRT